MTRVFLQVLSALVAFLAFAAAAQADTKGDDLQVAFNNACRTCHSMREGDNRLGPSLHGVVGRKAGSLEGYAYSSAMRQSGIVWDEKTLDAFITSPEQVVHGNAMKPFGGIDDAKQRGEIVAFLKSISE